MLYFTGIAISLFLALLLLSKKNKSQADSILAVWLFFTGIHLLSFNLFITRQYQQFPFLLGAELLLPLTYGPFLFLYVASLTNPHPVRKASFLHFVPFLIGAFSLFSFFILPFEEKVRIYENKGSGYESILSILDIAIMLSGVSYSLLSLRKLYRHEKSIGEQFSFTEKINLSWLRYLIIGSGIIWLIVIFGSIGFIYTSIVFYILFIGYFGIKQVGIFTNKHPQANDLSEVKFESQEIHAVKSKYEKSSLTGIQTKSIHQELTQLMEQEKLYSNPELVLTDLAQKLNIHPNALSQVINTIEQRNFFDYINWQRVEAFKQIVLLPENQKFTLLSLAFECGFNSKTSFNRNFKKATGLSPTQYLKQVNVELQ